VGQKWGENMYAINARLVADVGQIVIADTTVLETVI
jgi:hypothetical protein